MSKTTPLQTTLADLKKKIEDLKTNLHTASEEKAYFEQQIGQLYDQPLNARQMYELECAVVDKRAALYASFAGGYLDGHAEVRINTMETRPVSFDDYELIQDRRRVVGSAKHIDPDMVHKISVITDHGQGANTWHCFFFGDLVKQKLADLYFLRYGESVFTELPSIADRAKAVADLFGKVTALRDEMARINAEIEEASKPVREFMKAV